jgi:2-keto-4-pentenoate hydratase/2-oxohepta-3-ene-1,7-dioic acid hydratase in catechol pathway
VIAGKKEDLIIDANRAYSQYMMEKGEKHSGSLKTEVPSSMISFLEGGAETLERSRLATEYVLRRMVEGERLDGRKGKILHNRVEVKILAPIPFPRFIIDFNSFEKHVSNYLSLTGRSVPKEWYELPVCYKKNPGSVIGPDELVSWPSYTEKLDFELEMAVYVGRCKDIAAGQGFNPIVGYSVFNDFSARDVQAREMAVGLGPFKGKDFDTAGAFGPCLVTKEEVPDPQNLRMVARVNGETWSEGSTKDMYWKINELVEYASLDETLHPGTILGTGTVGDGCGVELGKLLKPNDVVELQIEGLGTLRNVIGRRASKDSKQQSANRRWINPN